MKTSIYNKEEHLEGYVGSSEKSKEKSDVQKAYEAGNETQEVTSFGKETIAEINSNKEQSLDKASKAKDGFDNTGTQGADSLSDDAYNSPDKHPTVESAESKTGSSGSDFKTSSAEDRALNTGI